MARFGERGENHESAAERARRLDAQAARCRKAGLRLWEVVHAPRVAVRAVRAALSSRSLEIQAQASEWPS
jgi:hypothetical protein